MENIDIKALKEKLFYESVNIYDSADSAEKAKITEYAKGYIDFLNCSKTERLAVNKTIELAEKNGFTRYEFGMPLVKGGKYYHCNRNKNICLFVIGSENPENGIRIAASHIDSPRLDLKPRPIYEDSGFCMLKTRYYGGIKKYQWTAIPLAMYGTVTTRGGKTVDIAVGDADGDPIFCITDLLPHLSHDQDNVPVAKAIKGEDLNILIGSEPLGSKGDCDERIKLNILNILNEKYGITEADFLSAEISFVPAFEAKELGLDRSLIGGYGHDDRVCAYPSLTAIFEHEAPKHTIMTFLADKEETGSDGNTGMKSWAFCDLINEIAKTFGANEAKVRENSKCLSADVNAAYDPTYASAYEKRNSAFANRGVVLTKYTGGRGKGGTSDASGEFVGFVRDIFEDENVVWQTGELGKVEGGGGGTVAKYIAEKNIDVVDLGVPVLSMHAPLEVIGKADVYMAHKAFSSFLKK